MPVTGIMPALQFYDFSGMIGTGGSCTQAGHAKVSEVRRTMTSPAATISAHLTASLPRCGCQKSFVNHHDGPAEKLATSHSISSAKLVRLPVGLLGLQNVERETGVWTALFHHGFTS